MTLYTPYSSEEIFSQALWIESKPRKTITHGNATIEVEILENGEGRIERIISTDPDDYLYPEYQPGKLIRISL